MLLLWIVILSVTLNYIIVSTLMRYSRYSSTSATNFSEYVSSIIFKKYHNNNLHISSLWNCSCQQDICFKRNMTTLNSNLNEIKAVVEHFMTEIKEKQKTNNFTRFLSGEKTVANAYSKNYFQILYLNNITTYFIRIMKTQSRYFQSSSSRYSSNKCSVLTKPNLQQPNAYHANCVGIEELMNQNNSYNTAFDVGLPFNYSFERKDEIILTFLHILKNVLLSNVGDVYAGYIKIIPQRCQQQLNYVSNFHKNVRIFENEVFTIAQFWGAGYFHALVEELPRIAPYLEFLKAHKNIKVHVNSKQSFIMNILNILGISSDRIITGHLQAKILYMPAGSGCGRPSLFNIQLLSMKLRSLIPLPPQERRTIVLIKRSKKRFFKHHDEIYTLIKNIIKDANIILEIFSDTELPSFNDTMIMFNRAFMVIGPHGAGESNLIFSEPGTAVIEGLCINHKHEMVLCYRNLMNALGHKYYGYVPSHNCFDVKAPELGPVIKYFVDIFKSNYLCNKI